jgi:hypothetical protein
MVNDHIIRISYDLEALSGDINSARLDFDLGIISKNILEKNEKAAKLRYFFLTNEWSDNIFFLNDELSYLLNDDDQPIYSNGVNKILV